MAWIESHWDRVTPVSALLYPVSLMYGGVAGLRRAAYQSGIAGSVRLPVPVIVVGNVTVGGTGKTPLTLWLAGFLRDNGRTPGIVCRGYGARMRTSRRVLPESDPLANGDEAVLLARHSGCEVWAGVDRAATARALLTAQPSCDIVVSDDGLQHYALARDLEICVVDSARGFGNGWLLPAGPLREPPFRLAQVDAVVFNGGPAPGVKTRKTPTFGMKLEGREFRNLLNPGYTAGAGDFHGKRVHAVAGTGDPERFFRHLQAMGLHFLPHSFPDHYSFTASDLAYDGAQAVLMTEKDAVKCRRFANETHWELPVDAVPDPALGHWVLHQLEKAA